jgi:simple sugar transport system substrate-binding protein
MSSRLLAVLTMTLVIAIVIGACIAAPAETPSPGTDEEFVFGIIMVGPHNDRGWSEAHFTAGRYVEANLPNSRMVYLDKLNPNDRPETTLEEAVDSLVTQEAQIIFITSDDFSADTYWVAPQYPDTVFVHISGDHVLSGEAPPNVGNYMGRMEYGKMIAGCAAALVTDSGAVGYLGPLINDETRRLVNSAYLGARYCYEHYRNRNPDELRFNVEWIGFWFHIPGVTLDPTEVTNELFEQRADVILSGIDTTEALVVASKRASEGEKVLALPYEYEGACSEAPEVCLGVPYFNWGPGYLEMIQEVAAGTWTQAWDWVGPDWDNINDRDTSAVGFLKGPALTEEQSQQLDQFITDLADESVILFKGPLNFQDGTTFLAEDEVAADRQIWYMQQLLEGMEGMSG